MTETIEITRPKGCRCIYVVGPSGEPMRFKGDNCDCPPPIGPQGLTAQEVLGAIQKASLGKTLDM